MPWHDPDHEAASTARFEAKMRQGNRVAARLERNWLLEAFPRGSRRVERLLRSEAADGDARIRGLEN
jgi:hypothetical protein